MREESAYFAKLGAQVTSMDVSTLGIHILRRRAAHNHLDIDARVGDVLHTGFSDETFDLVHGLGILHHVGLERGLAEVKRLLRRGGRAVFLEHMSSDFAEGLKHIVKRSLGKAEHYTEHEQPLRWQQCIKAGAQFSRYRIYPYDVLFRRRAFSRTFRQPSIQFVDYQLLRFFPPMRYFAGAVVLYAEK